MEQSQEIISDERILTLIQNSKVSEKGYRLLLEKYQERLYWHIRRLVLDHDDANDVVQNCFVKVFKNIHGFQQKSALYTWLYRIATNEAITFINNKNRKQAFSIEDEAINLKNQLEADPHFDGDHIQIRLQQAIQLLPEKQRAVFNLRYFEEMDYGQMSEVLETSVGALKASYHHAVKKIEKYFQEVEI